MVVDNIEKKVGENLDIILTAKPGGGYMWYIKGTEDDENDEDGEPKKHHDEILKFIRQKYEALPGYNGCKQHFIYKASKVGKTHLSFVYKRIWEEDAYDSMEIDVNVS